MAASFNMSPQLVAGGDIYPSTFAKMSTSANQTALAAGANDRVIGITGQSTRRSAVPNSDTKHAVATEMVELRGLGDITLLTAGTGGWTAGDLLKSDASGNGVTIATTGGIQQVGAVALSTKNAGELGLVQILIFSTDPSTSQTFGDLTVNSITSGDSSLDIAGLASSTGTGGSTNLAAGASTFAAGTGGALTGVAGAGGAAGTGGALTLAAGAPASGNGGGGVGTFSGGAGSGTGTGGAGKLVGGASAGATGTAGSATVDSGAKASGTGAPVIIGDANATATYINRGPLVSLQVGLGLTSLGTVQSSTPTSAQLLGGLVTQTGATGAGTVTLPTGTALSTACARTPAVGDSFDCLFMNVGGSQTLTITGQTGTTVIGTAAVGTGKAANMKFINTGTNLWSIYCNVSA